MSHLCRSTNAARAAELTLSSDASAAEANLKREVEAFWQAASCGEVYMEGADLGARLEAQAVARYALEPYIFDFADFANATGKRVLEIGVGMGADHLQWARGRPKSLVGVDLTERAISFTRSRLLLNQFQPMLAHADAESLPFADGQFDIVYSWGVIHHSPDTPKAVREIKRILADGGVAKVMIYHSGSIVGLLLWLRYALLRGRPWLSLETIYGAYLESPGTKAYSLADARALFGTFSTTKLDVVLSAGDLLDGEAGQRHKGTLLDTARKLWPRRLLKRYARRFGLFLMIEATK